MERFVGKNSGVINKDTGRLYGKNNLAHSSAINSSWLIPKKGLILKLFLLNQNWKED